MFKKMFLRGLSGFPLGVFIGYSISIGISVTFANGYYYPCEPALVEEVGSEIGAVILQAVLSGILGSSFAVSSIIWENENWNIAKQTGIYFTVISLTMLPIAYLAHWMERSLIGFITYFGIFILIFIFVWIVRYYIWKNRVKKLNENINNHV